jgi:Protein of unknown function (DUF2637)
VTADSGSGSVAAARSDQDDSAARREVTTPTTAPPTTLVTVVFTDPVLRRFLTGVIVTMVVVVLAVASAAFFTSFEAIRAFAERSGGINPKHAWLAPLLVDSFIFIASAADLWLTITGSSRSAQGLMQHVLVWSPKALLAFAAGGSFALNIAHAPDHIGAQAIAAVPPIALVLTFEILMMIVRRAVAARVARLCAEQAAAASNQGRVHTSTASAARPRATRSGGRRVAGGSDTSGGYRTGAAARAGLREKVEAVFLEREIVGGAVLEGKALAREIDGNDRRARRVQQILRDLRTRPTDAQRARIAAAREAAASVSKDVPALALAGGER